MKTQTDNSNIVVESLEDAAKKYAAQTVSKNFNPKSLDNAYYDVSYNARINGFVFGAQWKETQLQPLIDSHKQLYEALLEASNIFDNYPETHELKGTYEVVWDALNKAINLIQ